MSKRARKAVQEGKFEEFWQQVQQRKRQRMKNIAERRGFTSTGVRRIKNKCHDKYETSIYVPGTVTLREKKYLGRYVSLEEAVKIRTQAQKAKENDQFDEFWMQHKRQRVCIQSCYANSPVGELFVVMIPP